MGNSLKGQRKVSIDAQNNPLVSFDQFNLFIEAINKIILKNLQFLKA